MYQCAKAYLTNGPPPLAVGGVKVPVVVEGRRRRKLQQRRRRQGMPSICRDGKILFGTKQLTDPEKLKLHHDKHVCSLNACKI